jgi:hypothetical protein
MKADPVKSSKLERKALFNRAGIKADGLSIFSWRPARRKDAIACGEGGVLFLWC